MVIKFLIILLRSLIFDKWSEGATLAKSLKALVACCFSVISVSIFHMLILMLLIFFAVLLGEGGN